MNTETFATSARRLVFPVGLAALLLGVVFSSLASSPLAARAAPPAPALPGANTVATTSTGSYTVYLPLALRGFATIVYPNDPEYEHQWGMGVVNAPRAWGITRGGHQAVIAVLDTGVDLDHPDLATEFWINEDETIDGLDNDGNGYVDDRWGWNFSYNNNNPDDDRGHGTHVAGIAAAATNNSVGVSGLGWEALIMPLKVLASDGSGYPTDLVEAIYYAADNGATVINMSLAGGATCPSNVQAAVTYAYTMGVTLVAAGGNTGSAPLPTTAFPANCEHVLGIAATERNDVMASYSITGTHISAAAPGSEIYSTKWPGDNTSSYCKSSPISYYCYKWGTSMAAPHVAGLAALLNTAYPSYDPDQIASAMLDNARDLGAAGWDVSSGCGRIDAYAALANGAPHSSPQCLAGRLWRAETPPPPPDSAPFVAGQIIVSTRRGAGAAIAARYRVAAEPLPQGGWLLRVPEGQELTILNQLRSDPAVAWADLNYLVAEQ